MHFSNIKISSCKKTKLILAPLANCLRCLRSHSKAHNWIFKTAFGRFRFVDINVKISQQRPKHWRNQKLLFQLLSLVLRTYLLYFWIICLLSNLSSSRYLFMFWIFNLYWRSAEVGNLSWKKKMARRCIFSLRTLTWELCLNPNLFYFILFVTFHDDSFWCNFYTSFNIYSVVCKTSVWTHLPSVVEKTFPLLLSAARWDQLD